MANIAEQFVQDLNPANVVDVEEGMKTLFGPIFERIKTKDLCKNIKKSRPAARRDEAEEYILMALKDGPKLVHEIEAGARSIWIAKQTLIRAKKKLADEGIIKYRHVSRGQSKGVDWYVSLAEGQNGRME